MATGHLNFKKIAFLMELSVWVAPSFAEDIPGSENHVNSGKKHSDAPFTNFARISPGSENRVRK